MFFVTTHRRSPRFKFGAWFQLSMGGVFFVQTLPEVAEPGQTFQLNRLKRTLLGEAIAIRLEAIARPSLLGAG